MKNVLKKILVSYLVVTSLSLNYVVTFGEKLSEDEVKIEVYGSYLKSVMYFINDNYIKPVDLDKMLEDTIEGMVKSLNDENSVYYDQEKSKLFIELLNNTDFNFGVVYTLKNGLCVVEETVYNSYAEKAGILKGDIILKINNTPVKNGNLKDIINNLIDKEIYSFNIEIKRNSEIKNIKVLISQYDTKSVVYKDLNEIMKEKGLKNDIAYIKISTISENSADLFNLFATKASFNGKKKLILDLRGNGGGDVEQAIKICKEIVPKGNIVTAKNERGTTEVFKSENNKPLFEKIAVLVDSQTASSAEIIASAIKDSKIGFLVGEKTYGKGTIQGVYELQTEGMLKLTEREFISRNGNKINKVGISPDFYIKKLYITNKDSLSQYEEAIKFLGFKYKDLKELQLKNNLKETGILDDETVNFINNKIYLKYIKHDEVFEKAYKEL